MTVSSDRLFDVACLYFAPWHLWIYSFNYMLIYIAASKESRIPIF